MLRIRTLVTYPARPKVTVEKKEVRRFWTSDEDQTIEEMRPKHSWAVIAAKLGRSSKAVRVRASKMAICTEAGNEA